MTKYFSEQKNFFGNTNPKALIEKYGSPLYVYNETILRKSCVDVAHLINYEKFNADYSIKANSNLHLLKIAHEEGLHADAMSPGEIYVLLNAGFKPEEILYVCNNVSEDEMKYAVEKGVCTSIDSISQLKQFGRVNPGGKVAVRFNPGVGAGHHEKVVTAGKKTKFGVNLDLVKEIKDIANEYKLKIVGINQHIGSLFMEADPYIQGVKSILSVAEQFEELEFVDFGGGLGIPYHKQENQSRLDIKELGKKLTEIVHEWMSRYGRNIRVRIEPGRYVVAESSILLGTVHAIKKNYGIKYIGTDLGFNVLARPVMYDSHHDIEVYRSGEIVDGEREPVTVVGNICESGDIIARERLLPLIKEKDILGVMDAGAYGYSMSSNYNNRLRPAEVLIRQDGSDMLIRRRDTFEDIVRNFEV
ncbi:MAG: diaminopimelate decarboxylase [Bacillota bacterium]|nr:diaminopimelate decarboxylase [Bacillota bacterium]